MLVYVELIAIAFEPFKKSYKVLLSNVGGTNELGPPSIELSNNSFTSRYCSSVDDARKLIDCIFNTSAEWIPISYIGDRITVNNNLIITYGILLPEFILPKHGQTPDLRWYNMFEIFNGGVDEHTKKIIFEAARKI